MNPVPTISIVIPTYNRCDVVARTLDSLLTQEYPQDRVEIIVCDNSSDDTPETVRGLAASSGTRILLVSNDERLPAVKRNQGLKLAQGDLVLFLNDDVWLRPDALIAHAQTHSLHAEPIAVLGHVEQSAQMPLTRFSTWYRPFDYRAVSHMSDQVVPHRYFWSMNLSLPRRTMISRRLVFHEDWANIGHEDVELGYRWHQAGYRLIYQRRAWGEHYHPHDLDTACRLQYSIGRGLRDLQALVPEADLLERYGVFSLANAPRSVVRGLARKLLFNRRTVPFLQRRLRHDAVPTALAEWSYWKVMLHHTERGFLEQPPRRPYPVPTGPDLVEELPA